MTLKSMKERGEVLSKLPDGIGYPFQDSEDGEHIMAKAKDAATAILPYTTVRDLPALVDWVERAIVKLEESAACLDAGGEGDFLIDEIRELIKELEK